MCDPVPKTTCKVYHWDVVHIFSFKIAHCLYPYNFSEVDLLFVEFWVSLNPKVVCNSKSQFVDLTRGFVVQGHIKCHVASYLNFNVHMISLNIL